MKPIDLTHPEDADWMREEADSLQFRDRVRADAIQRNVRNQLLPVIGEELDSHDIPQEEQESLAQAILGEVSDAELEETYLEVSRSIDLEEVGSLEFVENIASQVATQLVEAHLNNKG